MKITDKKVMTKYIRVDWPESQKFEEHDRGNECLICMTYDGEDSSVMVPEDLYEEVMNELQFPKKYENTNLGTIVYYETRAIVNGGDVYWYDKELLKRGSEVLVYKHDSKEWIITKVVACSLNLPILLEDKTLMPGLNCELIGVKENA